MKSFYPFSADWKTRYLVPLTISILWFLGLIGYLIYSIPSIYFLIFATLPVLVSIFLGKYIDTYLFICIAFINFRVLDTHIGIFYGLFYIFFALLKFRNIDSNCFKIPIFRPLILFMCIGLLSYVNNNMVKASLHSALDFFVLSGSIFVVSEYIKSVYDAYKVFLVFLFVSVLNASQIVVTSFYNTGRIFGTTGLMFVDYVNIALIITLITFMINRKNQLLRIFLIFVALLLIYSSLVMQTRNSLIVLAIVSVLFLSYIFFNTKEYNINKTYLTRAILILAIAATISGIFLIKFNLVSTKRITNFSVNQDSPIEVGAESSLLTRLFIWDTALNGFKQHPLLGIGFYSFRKVSKQYSKLPDFIYENFVEGVTPHQGYIEILTETGLIGFIAFIYFLVSILKMGKEVLRLRGSDDERIVSLIAFWSCIYIIISLAVTDAWLWGSGSLVTGLIVGVTAGLYKVRKLQS